jgi:hypothetical protein
MRIKFIQDVVVSNLAWTGMENLSDAIAQTFLIRTTTNVNDFGF